jgi:hypothetical protein
VPDSGHGRLFLARGQGALAWSVCRIGLSCSPIGL